MAWPWLLGSTSQARTCILLASPFTSCALPARLLSCEWWGLVQICKPRDFAMQINLNMDNCWGIIRALVDLTLQLPEGKYLFVKEPNKPLLHLYAIPDGAFEQNYTDEPLPEAEEASAPLAPSKADAGDDEED